VVIKWGGFKKIKFIVIDMILTAKEIDREKCRYLDDLDKELPALVLAAHCNYAFTNGREWLSIIHQTAGHACNQHYMTGTILQPRPEIVDKIKQINDHWLHSNCGAWGVRLDEILEYRNQLKGLLGVDCNHSHRDFEEGLYPIDCSSEVVRKLASDNIPDNLDDFIKWDPGEICKHASWNLYILGINCD